MGTKFLRLVAFGLALPTGAWASDSVPVSDLKISPMAPEFGFDPDGLQAAVSFHQERVASGGIPGAVMLVARKGEIIFEAAVGYADLQEKTPLRTDHLFRIFSMTKPVITAAALQQIEAGDYTLDTPVKSILPEYETMSVGRDFGSDSVETVPAQNDITVRHLLTHTAGFVASWTGGPLADLYDQAGVFEGLPRLSTDRPRAPQNLTQFSERLAQLPLAHEPGARFTYGVSSDVMGRVIEVAAGQELDRYFSGSIFEPLKMGETSFCVTEANLPQLATLYEYGKAAELIVVDTPADSLNACPAGVFSGGGGLVSTIHDYWRFAEALRRGGELDGARIMSAETAALFEQPQEFVDESATSWWMGGSEWGLSVTQVVDPTKTHWKDVAGTYYWSGAASTYFWIDPKNEMVALIFTQILRNDQPNDVKWDYRNLVYDAFVDAPYPGQ